MRDPGTAKIDKIVLLYKPTTVQNARDAYAGDEDGELGTNFLLNKNICRYNKNLQKYSKIPYDV